MKDDYPHTTDDITVLLQEWREGNQAAFANLISLVYNELHQIAAKALHNQDQHTLQPTALINEAFIRLVKIKNIEWQNRVHFFAVAANIMRRVLIDYARAHYADKRGKGRLTVQLDEAIRWPGAEDVSIITLDDALSDLARLDPRQSEIVELRFFGGLSIEETAQYLSVSEATVVREWRTARAWLHNSISKRLPNIGY